MKQLWPFRLRWRQDFIHSYLERDIPQFGPRIAADLKPVRKFVVYPGADRYRLAEDIEAIPLVELAAMLRG
ncbi:hypothetical protein [Sulfuritalea sp.]|mgnify:CR=1 FL=1|uniref:hypothetical protein n=1 Tax=Sulfuritalea sp. TaxID=2480090 RepID=UPI00286DAC33|nr:hypothetical protein [Sulfuritalea sp.]